MMRMDVRQAVLVVVGISSSLVLVALETRICPFVLWMVLRDEDVSLSSGFHLLRGLVWLLLMVSLRAIHRLFDGVIGKRSLLV